MYPKAPTTQRRPDGDRVAESSFATVSDPDARCLPTLTGVRERVSRAAFDASLGTNDDGAARDGRRSAERVADGATRPFQLGDLVRPRGRLVKTYARPSPEERDDWPVHRPLWLGPNGYRVADQSGPTCQGPSAPPFGATPWPSR